MPRKKTIAALSSVAPVILAIGFFIIGIVFWTGLEMGMEATNNEEFCISCHEMGDNVYPEYRRTVHYINRTGVRATCPDCHVPRTWTHKVMRKIHATNELYHWAIGTVDTREKFLNKRNELAEQVWASMRASDSRECRNCHGEEYMALADQTPKAKKMHILALEWDKTCIDCHQGIAHTLPDEFDKGAVFDQLHEQFEQQAIACHECHDDVQAQPDDEEW